MSINNITKKKCDVGNSLIRLLLVTTLTDFATVKLVK